MAVKPGLYGPLMVPVEGTEVTVYFTYGLGVSGIVTDQFEDGTGYIVNDDVMVHCVDVHQVHVL